MGENAPILSKKNFFLNFCLPMHGHNRYSSLSLFDLRCMSLYNFPLYTVSENPPVHLKRNFQKIFFLDIYVGNFSPMVYSEG